jgi:hypothetical protein
MSALLVLLAIALAISASLIRTRAPARHVPTGADRLQAYASRLGGHYDALDHARRAEIGRRVIRSLNARDRRELLQRRRRAPEVVGGPPSNVQPLPKRRRA